VIATRAVLALPVLWAWAVWRVGLREMLTVPRAALAGTAAAGVLCYYVGTLFNFYALTLVDASVERVLLFSYPSIVVLLHSVLYRRMPTLGTLVALVLTYAGILMVVSGLDVAIFRANLAGAGFVLVCALTFSIYYLASDRYTPRLGSVRFTVYALTAATACLVVHGLVRDSHATAPWNAHTTPLMLGLVVFGTVLPMLSMAEGVRRLGAQRAAVVSTIGPPTTILLGAWLLHERLTVAQWSGVLLIVAGIVVLEVLRRRAPGPAPD
jgi:drug/metabolite transporter (DMT)-like permease